MVTALVIVGETYRGSRHRQNERSRLEDEIVLLKNQVEDLNQNMKQMLIEDDQSFPGISPWQHVSQYGSTSTGVSEQYLSLLQSVQLLWKLAEQHGWLKEPASFSRELQWMLDEKTDVSYDKGQEPKLKRSEDDVSEIDDHASTDTSSSRFKKISQERARAIVNEIRQMMASPFRSDRSTSGQTSSFDSQS